jgi:tetratricopeptide (TPR) repeat protein
MSDAAPSGEGYLQQALNLSPRDPLAFNWMFIGGSAKLHLGAYEEAAKWLRQSLAANPNFAPGHLLLAAALSQLGRIEEARAEIKTGLAFDPKLTISLVRNRESPNDDPSLA